MGTCTILLGTPVRFFPCLLLFLSLTVPSIAVAQNGPVWPDGSAMEDWFLFKGRSEQPTRRFLVTDYGARADSTRLQTECIQKAIDAAFEAGGGTVVIPEGVFLSSSLFFRPRTALHLERGARLKGSDDISDYPVCQVHIEGVIQPYIAALVNAYQVDGFSITGEGTIDGSGLRYWRDFWKRREVNPQCTNLEALRPRMVYVAGSRDVFLEGVHLMNSGFWTLHLYKCSYVRVSGVRITAPREPVRAPSSDGIDLDACRMVHVWNCQVSVNDDIIALKGGKGPWADRDEDNGTNEKVLVENCVFGHGPGVLTFGSECIGASNIILRDSEVHGADRLVWLKMRPDTPQEYRHILVENVRGEAGCGLYVHPWTQFFDLKDRRDIPMSYGRHVTIRNCDLRLDRETDIVEQEDQYLLEDIRLEF